MAASPNSDHMQTLAYAYAPARSDRIARRPFTKLYEMHSASLPSSIAIKPERFCFVEQVDSPFIKPFSVHAFAWTTNFITSPSWRPPWRV